MKIVPSEPDFKNWGKCVPMTGDLIFLDSTALQRLEKFNYPILTAEEVRAQSLTLWKLNNRSWYGYALNKVRHCVWLPIGEVEELKSSTQKLIAQSQIRLKVPTLVKSQNLHPNLHGSLKSFGHHYWCTSKAWVGLSVKARSVLLKGWWAQNEIHTYESVALKRLPNEAQDELRRLQFNGALNRHAPFSGPNCLATTAAAAANNVSGVGQQWLHGPPFLRFIKRLGYNKIATRMPLTGDVLVFSKANQIVHAAYALSNDYYFEKPGQDFYEPYRIERFENWKREWPKANLEIWRKE